MNKHFFALSTALAALFAAPLLASRPEQATDAQVIAAQRPSYPLEVCVVSGEELGSMGDPYELVIDGHLLRLCCKSCVKGVQAEPAAAIEKVEQAVIKQQGAFYPLEVCPISGELLGPDAKNVVVGTRLVRTCCSKCAKVVQADPSKALPKIDAALIEKQRPVYPLTICVVSGEELADAHEFLYGVRLVRTCCPKCERAFVLNPDKYLPKLKAAAEAGAKQPAPDKSGLEKKSS